MNKNIVIHLNDYDEETRQRVLKNFLSAFNKTSEIDNDTKPYVTVKSIIKETGTSDPTITITNTGFLSIEEILEI